MFGAPEYICIHSNRIASWFLSHIYNSRIYLDAGRAVVGKNFYFVTSFRSFILCSKLRGKTWHILKSTTVRIRRRKTIAYPRKENGHLGAKVM